ncbi:MFS transporter [Rhodococcus sp. IEGM 1381]|uniref:MFS transporter n=1 Tax=Rhodococcus sp. IEGM 1381 TaxID=3047085 RepID=UPI0024B7D4CD|nr:MFS transporter [Rhodococcus sp. IEGM 1381]MDI9894257.1 MFS transporter [Rhodococcus sp. IEGM 1381]
MPATLGRNFRWLWAAYATSTYGTWIAFGAFPLIAIQVLDASAFAVSLLDAAALMAAALIAFPLGPWVERRMKRPVMIAADTVRCVAMSSVPITYALGALTYGQLLVVSVVSGSASIVFTAASGAHLKHLAGQHHLLAANSKFEGTNWVAIAAGPPVGGALVGLLGPVVTVAANAFSFLLSAFAVARISGTDVASVSGTRTRSRTADLWVGWQAINRDNVLLRLFLNSVLVGGLIMATGPLLAVLMLGEYHFSAWQYGLAFGLPALGGFLGARLAPRLVDQYDEHTVMLTSGWLRALFPIGLTFIHPGVGGLLTVITVEALLITSMGVFNPIYATQRLRRTPPEQAAQVLSTWNALGKLVQAALMVIWGVLATLTSPLTAITCSGALLFATPLLLPRRTHPVRARRRGWSRRTCVARSAGTSRWPTPRSEPRRHRRSCSLRVRWMRPPRR